MRKILLSVSFILALATLTTPATAQYYRQGGVIPGSADDYSFRHGRWVPNHRGHVGPGVHRGGHVGGHGGGVIRGHSSGARFETYQYHRRTIIQTCTRAHWVQVCTAGICTVTVLGNTPCL